MKKEKDNINDYIALIKANKNPSRVEIITLIVFSFLAGYITATLLNITITYIFLK